MQTSDLTVARRRAVRFVEERIRQDLLASDPKARTACKGIAASLAEYLADLRAGGNTEKQANLVKTRIERVIAQAKLKEFAQIDAIVVKRAISKIMEKHKFGIVTANKHAEALRAWTKWMFKNNRWPTNALENLTKLKGDTTPRKQRAILSDLEFAKLLQTTLEGLSRRNLTGEQRHYLYLLAGMTGLRAQELHSLKPTSFNFVSKPATVTVHCTISKRRKTDTLLLHPDLVAMIKPGSRATTQTGDFGAVARLGSTKPVACSGLI